jgi:hypothetical protein
MDDEPSRAGTYEHEGGSYPRLQLLTILDIQEKRAFPSPIRVGSRIATGRAVLPLQGSRASKASIPKIKLDFAGLTWSVPHRRAPPVWV